jgi:hypothetical protein
MWLFVVDIRLLEFLLDRAKCGGITQPPSSSVRKFWIFPLAVVCGASVWSDEKGDEGNNFFTIFIVMISPIASVMISPIASAPSPFDLKIT